MSEQLLRVIANVLRAEAGKYLSGTDESEAFADAADALDDVADLLEALNG